MNKINKQSADLHEEKLKAFQSIMPQLFNEDGTIDTKELEMLSKNYPSLATGKYEFNWADKISAKRNAYKPSRANLKPDKERSIEFDSTENIIIEGDNLEVLKLLQKSYSGKIKCIYIDPPYNTGNDFVYSDDYSEDKKAYWEKSGTTENGVKIDTNTETQGRYHSNWLNMMYPRLVLARELLKDDGVIFVSIDEIEFHNLRKIMDEIFGEENYAGEIVWKNSSKNDQHYISMQHEYILSFVKDKNSCDGQWNEKKDGLEDIYRKFDELRKKYGNDWDKIHLEAVKWYKTFPPSNPIFDSKHYSYMDERGIYFPSDISGPNYGQYRYELLHPITQKACKEPASGWRYPEETMKQKVRDNLIHFGKDETTIPNNKTYLSDTEYQSLTSIKYKDSRVASKLLSRIFKRNIFNNPKDHKVLNSIFNAVTLSENDIILDFFAGSGTTAHAVMDLNKEDGGNRKYILVQLPELTDEKSEAYKAGYKTISDICIERVKRVSEKIKKEDEGKLLKEGKNLDLGFKVFKLAPSFFPENQFTPNPEKSEEENMKAFEEYLTKAKSQMKFEFEEEELLYETALKDGFKLTFNKELIEEIKENKVYKISDGEKEALVCLDDTISNSTLKILEGMKEMRFICLERAVDTTKKWNLKSIFGQNLWVA